MDHAESGPSPDQPGPGQPGPGQPGPAQPGRAGRPFRTPSPKVAAAAGADVPGPASSGEPYASALRLQHPVIAGYDGSASSRNALAYAAGVSRRLGRPLLVVYVCSSGVYCEPLTG
ncbi:MAG TPA: universal stress protein, partial [Streptosporangiaceae bacterium]|nr:universal stress protein [Streptosporangiaceae bacterium]